MIGYDGFVIGDDGFIRPGNIPQHILRRRFWRTVRDPRYQRSTRHKPTDAGRDNNFKTIRQMTVVFLITTQAVSQETFQGRSARR